MFIAIFLLFFILTLEGGSEIGYLLDSGNLIIGVVQLLNFAEGEKFYVSFSVLRRMENQYDFKVLRNRAMKFNIF